MSLTAWSHCISGIHHTPHNVLVQHTSFNKHVACIEQHAAYNAHLKCAPCNAQHAPHNMQHAARNMRGVKFRARANDPAAAAALAEMCKRETGQHFAPGSITMRPTAPNPSQVRRGTRLRAGAGRSRDCDDRYAQLVHHELQSPAPRPAGYASVRYERMERSEGAHNSAALHRVRLDLPELCSLASCRRASRGTQPPSLCPWGCRCTMQHTTVPLLAALSTSDRRSSPSAAKRYDAIVRALLQG